MKNRIFIYFINRPWSDSRCFQKPHSAGKKNQYGQIRKVEILSQVCFYCFPILCLDYFLSFILLPSHKSSHHHSPLPQMAVWLL